MSSNRVLIIALAISLFGHCLFLFIPRFNFISSPVKKWKDVVVEIEIKKPRRTLPRYHPPTAELRGRHAARPPSRAGEAGSTPHAPRQKPESRKQKKEINEKKKEKFVTKKVPRVGKKPQWRKKKFKKAKQGFKKKIAQKQKAEGKREEEIKVIEKVKESSISIVETNKLMLRYQDMVKQKIEKCKKYPKWAKKQGFEGIIYLAFTILSNGEIKNLRITYPSEFDILNREAIATVRRASPFLPIPEDFNRSYVEMEVVVVFKLR